MLMIADAQPRLVKSADRPWTAEEDQTVRDMRAKGATWPDIASLLGRGGSSTRQRLLLTLREPDPHPDIIREISETVPLERRPVEKFTRDGMPSIVVEQILRDIEADAPAPIEVTATDGLQWAIDNKVPLHGPKRLVQINNWRTELGLPPFRVVENAPPLPREKGPRFKRISTMEAAALPRLETPRPVHSAALKVPMENRPPRPLLEPLAKSQDELLELVTTCKSTRTALVTPDVARWLLFLNTDNRPLTEREVRRFRKILQEDRWMNTGEPVIVSSDSVINDGQHRLTAIARSGIAAPMDVRFGIDREAFKVTGTGTRRTANNVVSMAGHKNASMQSGIARLLAIHDLQMMAQHNVKVDTDVILATVGENPLIGIVSEFLRKTKFGPAKSAPFGMVMVVAARSSPIRSVEEFAAIAGGGLCEREEMAPRRLHIRLRDEALSRSRMTQLDLAVLTAKAWNAWAESRDIASLKINDIDRTSAGFPVVKAFGAQS